MGTPQTIVYGLPFQFDSCHGLLMCDQSVASMKSWAYLTELAEPSQLAGGLDARRAELAVVEA